MAERTPEHNHHPAGSEEEVARLVPLVYDELRRIAAGLLRRSGDKHRTLQPTALVHEAFLNMTPPSSGWTDERHFRAIASLAMRRVLADHVRGRNGQKRGGGKRPIALSMDVLGAGAPPNAAELDAALEELEASRPRMASLVIFRFFGDLSVEQAADRLNISLSTAEADWRFARAWLIQRLRGNAP